MHRQNKNRTLIYRSFEKYKHVGMVGNSVVYYQIRLQSVYLTKASVIKMKLSNFSICFVVVSSHLTGL